MDIEKILAEAKKRLAAAEIPNPMVAADVADLEKALESGDGDEISCYSARLRLVLKHDS